MLTRGGRKPRTKAGRILLGICIVSLLFSFILWQLSNSDDCVNNYICYIPLQGLANVCLEKGKMYCCVHGPIGNAHCGYSYCQYQGTGYKDCSIMINFKWVFFGLGAVCCIAGIIVEAISRSKPKHENLLDRERIAYRDRARRNPPAVVNY